jgi:hypothetical protein
LRRDPPFVGCGWLGAFADDAGEPGLGLSECSAITEDEESQKCMAGFNNVLSGTKHRARKVGEVGLRSKPRKDGAA